MNDLSFAHMNWSYLVWGVFAFLLVIAWFERRGNQALSQFINSPSLQKVLVHRISKGRLWLRLLFLGMTGIFLTLALMRPQWGFQLISTPQVGAELMICLDVSKSMLAEDVAPNRLQRAKAEINDLLNLIAGDQVGLIAFAGRATVLSPMTPDFGFLRLTLRQAGSHSVTRGGTRLEEPIRKAIAGFQNNTGAAQAIILITDGEDHDSFPLEAAKLARERGINIITIGFGDENGSEIVITDIKTGSRKVMHDSEGQVIISRLDGALLRQIALITEGVYIPAGTGVLDLEAIYQQHIATLMRGNYDGQSRTVQNDAFQWAILIALVFFIAAILVMSPAKHAFVWLLVPLFMLNITPESHALEKQEKTLSKEKADIAPRKQYNHAVNALKSKSYDTALTYLNDARNEAASDGELRFNASYNLGWLKVQQAKATLEKNPKQALTQLEAAANWFREAIQIRPKQQNARYNLEIVLRRIMLIRDQMTSKEKGDIANQLATLIQGQRGLVAKARPLIDVDSSLASNKHLFRTLASQQLELLSNSQQVNEQVDREIVSLKEKPKEEQEAKADYRLAQLTQLQFYLQQATARMGKARSQVRRSQAERAFRRMAMALSELKRAEDQLLDPVKRLEHLIKESAEIIKLTAIRAQSMLTTLQAESAKTKQWLTKEYLEEAQKQVQSRLMELHLGLQSGLKQTPPKAEQAKQDKAQQKFIAELKQAEPLLAKASEAFALAIPLLSQDKPGSALSEQQKAWAYLTHAREIFLTLKPLIDLLSQSQKQIQSFLKQDEENPKAALEFVDVALQYQIKNIKRDNRIRNLIVTGLFDALNASEAAEKETPETSTTAKKQDPGRLKAEKERMEKVDKLHIEVTKSLVKVEQSLLKLTEESAELLQTRRLLAESVSKIEDLRRLFYSMVAHLQETLKRQQSVADETESGIVLMDKKEEAALEKAVGPLMIEQQSLIEISDQIAQSLFQQAKQPPEQASQNANPEQQQKLKQAASHVSDAKKEMQEAFSTMNDKQLKQARISQDKAIDALKQGLMALQPPQKPSDKAQEQEKEEQKEEQKQGQEKDDKAVNEQGNMEQMLQAIKDREAKRQQEKQRKNAAQKSGYEAVEKDW